MTRTTRPEDVTVDRTAVLAVGLAVVMLASTLAAGGVLAQADPPEVPAAYHGEVTINDQPAPVGTNVTAVVDGEVRGSITVAEEGVYGGPGWDDPKLEVPGTSDDDGEAVTFLVDGVEAETDPSTVPWSAGDHAEVDLAVEIEPHFAVTIDEGATDTEVDPGEPATIVATVENTGGVGEADIDLLVEGTVEDSESVELATDEATDVTFAHTFAEAAHYDVTVASPHDTGSVTITVGDPPAPAEFVLANLDPASIEVTEGDEPVDIAVDVENVGEQPGEQDITLTLRDAGDDIVGTDTVEAVEVAPDASTTVTFESVPLGDLAAGTYTHEVTSDDDAVAGTITVAAPPPADFQLANLDPETVDATEGDDPIDVAVDAENVGEQPGVQDLVLAITDANGTVVYTQTVASVELAQGESDTVTFADVPVGELDAGEYTHAVASDNDSIEGTIDVAAGPVTLPDPLPGFGIAVAVLALVAFALVRSRGGRERMR